MKTESQPKFTPGPWKPGLDMDAYIVGSQDRQLICSMDDLEVESRANASLIAQAPAMYAAMQEFCDRVERGEVRSRKTYEQFKSILAAARGEVNQQQP